MRRSLVFGGLLAALLLHCPGGALAKDPQGLPAQAQAFLAGRAIPLDHVVRHHCHDLAFPVYRCFDTDVERDADALTLGAELLSGSDSLIDDLLAPLSTSSFTFALAYTLSNYGGSSLLISAPNPDLGSIGWSNVISSFKSTNGGRPKWWEYASYTGDQWQWATSAWVPYVGTDADNQFTSVKNVP